MVTLTQHSKIDYFSNGIFVLRVKWRKRLPSKSNIALARFSNTTQLGHTFQCFHASQPHSMLHSCYVAQALLSTNTINVTSGCYFWFFLYLLELESLDPALFFYFNSPSSKIVKYEKTCSDNQYFFISFVFNTFDFLIPKAVVPSKKRVIKISKDNVL
jgi:hypothetical protein